MFKQILKTVKLEKTKSDISSSTDKANTLDDLLEKKQTQKFVWSKKVEKIDLQQFQVGGETIPDVFYIPNFLTNQEHDFIMDSLYEKQDRWNVLQHAKRRVQKYGGDVTEAGLQNQEDLPIFLKQLSQTIKDAEIFGDDINHALINEYQAGNGIMNHFDGPLYLGFVNIFSLGGTCIFKFTDPNNLHQQCQFVVEPNSLFIFTNDAYTKWYHGIDYVDEDLFLMRVEENQQIATNILNYDKTLISLKVEQALKNGEIQIRDNNNDVIATLEKLVNNHQFNWVVAIKRKPRVSITLRHVWLEKQ